MLNSDKQKETLSETVKKHFSFKNNGIGVYHAAPAAAMIAAGLALSALIGEASPAIISAAAAPPAVFSAAAYETVSEEETTQKSIKDGEVSFVTTLYSDIADLKSKEPVPVIDMSKYSSKLSEETLDRKIAEAEQLKELKRELMEAAGQKVYAGNRNLYLDHYRYSLGPSKIPDAPGGYVRMNSAGIPMSQMQAPPSLELDENGVPKNYYYYIDGNATAYYGGPMTSTGSRTRQGVVAVDPRMIPYGTEMYITSLDGRYIYGFCRAEDTGGFIYNNRRPVVDLYMETYADCCLWGWRGVRIYILPSSYK